MKKTCALLPALLLLAGCLLSPELHRKGAFSTDNWETWTSWNDAFGEHEVAGGRLRYRLGANQDDQRDMPFDGRSPGLLVSRPVGGADWRVDASARFKLARGRNRSFSFGVWTGRDGARPSIYSTSAALKLLARRGRDADGADYLAVSAPPARDTPVRLPPETKTLRFEKKGGDYSVSYSLDGREFKQAVTARQPELAGAEARKFFIGGMAEGDPDGSYAEFYSVVINGREVLR